MSNEDRLNYFKYFEDLTQKNPFNQNLNPEKFSKLIKQNNDFLKKMYETFVTDLTSMSQKNMKSITEINNIVSKLIMDQKQTTDEKLKTLKTLSESTLVQSNEQIEFINRSRQLIFNSISKHHSEVWDEFLQENLTKTKKQEKPVKA